jgi:hypothetical protein
MGESLEGLGSVKRGRRRRVRKRVRERMISRRKVMVDTRPLDFDVWSSSGEEETRKTECCPSSCN